jgi:hypothetical protein
VSGLKWTFIRPGMFATDTRLWWADSIRTASVVRLPDPTRRPGLTMKGHGRADHEKDMAARAVTALTEPGACPSLMR